MKKYIQAVAIWCSILPLAILNGGLRESVLSRLGSIALPLSGLILCVCIFAMAFIFVPRIKKCTSRDYMVFGLIWFLLTNLFDWVMLVGQGGNVGELWKAYDWRTGNLWTLVVLTAAIAPYLAGRLKHTTTR